MYVMSHDLKMSYTIADLSGGLIWLLGRQACSHGAAARRHGGPGHRGGHDGRGRGGGRGGPEALAAPRRAGAFGAVLDGLRGLPGEGHGTLSAVCQGCGAEPEAGRGDHETRPSN